MNRSSRSRKRRKGRSAYASPLENPVIRVILAALAVVLIVLVCVGATRLMPKVDPAALEPTAAPGTPTPVPTPTPIPTPTPTPAEFAPFGAQYGYGGADLIPETPTPVPTAAPSPTLIPAPTSVPTATPVQYTTLRKGASGPSVMKLQEALIALGYLSGGADGDFGTNTYNAVVQFQAVNGLSADGIAGAKTLTLLYSGNALDASHAPEMDYLILVNRENKLDKHYAPTDLVKIADVIPDSVLKVKYKDTRANRTATEALGRMLEDAIADGIGDWQVSSAYRGYSDQQALVDQSVNKYKKNNPDWSRDRCLSATYQTVAPAGTSEHMTGLAFDITVPGVSFSGTKQQKWLHEHCYEYGFVVRFPEGKTSVTGFLAESWHFRYVGTQAAQVMAYNDWVLEEYIEKMSK